MDTQSQRQGSSSWGCTRSIHCSSLQLAQVCHALVKLNMQADDVSLEVRGFAWGKAEYLTSNLVLCYRTTTCGRLRNSSVVWYVRAAFTNMLPFLEPPQNRVQMNPLQSSHSTLTPMIHSRTLRTSLSQAARLVLCNSGYDRHAARRKSSICRCASSHHKYSFPCPLCTCPQTCNVGLTRQHSFSSYSSPSPPFSGISRCHLGGLCVTRTSIS